MSFQRKYWFGIVLFYWTIGTLANKAFLIRSPVPYLVSVESNDEFKCAGVIISVHWILSVATKLFNVSEKQVVVRVKSSTPLRRGAIYRVSDLIIHPLYNENDFLFNNIALLKLYTRLTFSGTLYPVSLWPHSPTVLDGVGWQEGWKCLQGDRSTHRRQLVSRRHGTFLEQTSSMWPEGCSSYDEKEGLLCVQTTPGDNSGCKADLGYVLMVDKSLTGLGLLTVNKTVVIYTAVAHHVGWIFSAAINMN